MKGRGHLLLLMPAAALAALWLAWRGLAMVDFAYPVFYRVMDIHGHIQQFGPENRFRTGFETTTPEERARLFGAIVDAIHDDGRGLAELRYHGPDGKEIAPLLHEAEIIHLQDVARLVNTLAPAGWLALAWTLVHLGLIYARAWPVPPLGRMVASSLLVVGLGTAALLIAGFRDVFYALHEWIFPEEHQWFFYYQDSLMSTMMKAPWLFAGIGALLLVVALGIYLGILAGARRLYVAASVAVAGR